MSRGALLTASGEERPLRRKSFELLRMLVVNAGCLLDRETVNQAIWPEVIVTDDSITQCIRDIRLALDDAAHCLIRTVPRRGYIFTGQVNVTAGQPVHRTGAHPLPAPGIVPPAPGLPDAPRLSIAVLPFHNGSADQEQEYLADGITDDLITDLSQLSGAFVIARSSAYAYKDSTLDVQRIGRELGVRYVLAGSLRRLGDRLRVNTQLSSSETGTGLWAERFDCPLSNLADLQDEIVARLRSALNVKLIDFEGVRSIRERPDNPDAHDLVLRARSLQHKPRTRDRNQAIITLYEQALALDGGSIAALTGLARALLASATLLGEDPTVPILDRVAMLLSDAASIDADHPDVLLTAGHLLRQQQQWHESATLLQRLIDIYPTHAEGYARLGFSRIRTGDAAEAVPLIEMSLRLDPRNPAAYLTQMNLGYALLLLEQYDACIQRLQQTLLASPESPRWLRAWSLTQLASAFAWTGQLDEARKALAQVNQLEPHDTVRSHFPEVLDRRYMVQIERYREGLRSAGLRDHADETADFRVAADVVLHSRLRGFTPLLAPGATTIHTGELAALLSERRPLVIDTVSNFWGLSIPGATGLRGVGVGGDFHDQVQARLSRKIQELTRNDLNTCIVTVGWNSERFGGYKLMRRLVALGYRNVHWYRGGREAWEVAGLPEAELRIEPW